MVGRGEGCSRYECRIWDSVGWSEDEEDVAIVLWSAVGKDGLSNFGVSTRMMSRDQVGSNDIANAVLWKGVTLNNLAVSSVW